MDHYPGTQPHRSELTIQDLFAIFRRRRGIILITTAVVTVLLAIMCATATKLYKATAEIQVQKESADALSLNNMIDSAGGGSDALESNITLQTEAQILQSESLALSVIKPLKLDEGPDFRSKFNPISWVLGLFAEKGVVEPKDVPLEDAPGRRSHAVKVFESRLKVKAVSGTRLIDIEYLSSDPKTAAAVVNMIVQNLSTFNFETRHTATEQASGWLTDQLAGLRKQSESLQSQVVGLQKDSGLFTLGQTDAQGGDKVYAPVLDRLQQATTNLTEAQSARIMKGALYQVVKDGDPELISSLAGNSLSGASSGLNGSLTLLQGFRAQEAQTQAQLNELSAKFGPSYPKVIELQANLAGIHKAIHDESARIAGRVKNDYAVSQQIENNDRIVFDREKAEAESINSKAVEYNIVKQEANQSRTLYENLLGRLKEADLVAGLHSTNITLVDPARVPARPSKPNTPLYAAGGLGGGLLLGICLALFREATDGRIQDLSTIDALGTQAPIGFLPYFRSQTLAQRIRGLRGSGVDGDGPELMLNTLPAGSRSKSLVAALAPRSAYTEALRALRTSLMQSGTGRVPPQVLLITSSIPGEGKSMLSANLAVVYAQSSKRVLLVDGDLRTPTLHHLLGINSTDGLGSLLNDSEEQLGSIRPVRITLAGMRGFDVVPVGTLPTYPAELLASDEMAEQILRWRKEYDFIIIDGAPLLPVTDSALLSRYADFTLVVARHNVTDQRSLGRTCQILQSQGIRKIGVVLNGIKNAGGAHHRYYGYKQTEYQGAS